MGDPSNRAKSIFLAAVEEHAPDRWPAFLDEVCAGDAGLRAEVERLLRARSELGSFREAPRPDLAPTVDEPSLSERPGSFIGPYKLLEQIGEGGFGVVFMAEQTQPVRRKVALKVLKPGMDSRQVVARFEAERQALALMDHPNIAHVFDGGQTPSGRPYFVMELVKGIPITDFCDQSQFGVRDRLGLFLSVCQAVQHSHQKGVIHRDLKPSNVLVTLHGGTPVAKVIDFGIAKAVGQELTEKTLFTHFAQLVGTPLYMSPEQSGMSGLDVDTRSDVYSLGVLLYELLTGTTPFDRERLRTVGYDEMRRIIREEEPPPPSTRLSTIGRAAATVSANRGSDPRRLRKLFRGELDWVVMRALEKDRDRRYESASAFAADVRRYLHDEPVLACPPSAWYRLRKFARRHRGKVTAAAVMLALLLAGTAVSTWQAVRATRAEGKAGGALAEATAANAQTREALDVLTDGVVETLLARQPELEEPEKAFLRKVLGFYEKFTRQSGETAGARFLRARGHFKVAYLYNLLGKQHEAAAGYRQAETLLGRLAGEFPGEPEYRHALARTEGNLGIVLAEIGKPGEAETAFRRALDLRTNLEREFRKDPVYRQELALTHHELGVLLESQEKYADAESAYRQALGLEEKGLAETGGGPVYRQGLARTRSILGCLLRKQERYAEAEEVLRHAVKMQEALLREFPVPGFRRELADSYQHLGIVLTELKREAEAEALFLRAVELYEKLRDQFPQVLQYRRDLARRCHNLGYFLSRRQKYAGAEKAYRRALELTERLVAEHDAVPAYHQDLARTHFALGHLLRDQKKPGEAEESYHRALLHQTKLVNDSPEVPVYRNELVDTLVNLALLHLQRQEFPAGVELLERARSHLRAALKVSPKHPVSRRFYRDNLGLLARSYLALGDHSRLAATADDLGRFGHEPAPDAYLAACMLCSCVGLAGKDGKLDEAGGYADRAVAMLRQAVANGYKDVARMKADRNLDPLRTRAEFRKLIAELEGKAKE